MAWPCISRVCCLARFWNQFDKSDLSVPLTIQNYSDISEQEVRSVTRQLERTSASERTSSAERTSSSAERTSHRARREPSYKPREDYQPFPSVTQYKQDFKPWPIPRKGNFPWISNGNSNHGPPEERVRGEQEGQEERKTSSYRQEYRPWTGVKPAKSARRNPPAQYSSPGTEATLVPRETSYQAAYNVEAQRSTGPHQGDHIVPSASTNVQPAAVPQPAPPILQAGPQPGPPAQRTEPAGATKPEEHLVRTKLPPNPSAVFQSGSRVFNI